jgi:chromosome segregation ATPase
MEEIMQLKDDAEKRIGELEREVLELRKKSTDLSGDSSNLTTVNQKQEELIQQKNVEIDKLRSREKHFKESNEIFQQKLQILTEENRKLRGQRPLNSL